MTQNEIKKMIFNLLNKVTTLVRNYLISRSININFVGTLRNENATDMRNVISLTERKK